MWVRKRLRGDLVFGYVAAQLLGALVASLVLAMIFPDEVGLAQLGTPALGARISSLQGFAVESAITFLLTMVVLTSTRSNSPALAGLAIGGTLTGIILFAGPLTGGAANPARYLGPAIVSRNIDDIWLYLTAPLFGAGLAAFVSGFVVETPTPDSEDEGEAEEEGHDEEPVGSAVLPEPKETAAKAPAIALEAQPVPALAEALKTARELYFGGESKKAAAALVPLLASASEEGGTLDAEVRSLLMVIEDASGPLEVLEGYRHVLGQAEPKEDPPSPVEPEPQPQPAAT
jgi:hypothetical protein